MDLCREVWPQHTGAVGGKVGFGPVSGLRIRTGASGEQCGYKSVGGIGKASGSRIGPFLATLSPRWPDKPGWPTPALVAPRLGSIEPLVTPKDRRGSRLAIGPDHPPRHIRRGLSWKRGAKGAVVESPLSLDTRVEKGSG